jgi:sirohydrochlorin cobaltochelatase
VTKPAVLVCGHGSRDNNAIEEFKNLVELLKINLPNRLVSYGFLEFARPTISEQLIKIRDSKIKNVEAIPGMLFAAGHAKNDIPSVLNNFMNENNGFTINYGRELAIHPKILSACRARIEEAEASCSQKINREETLLLVVGRGTSDPDANSNISKVARILWEGMGFGWAEIAYTGVTFPLIGPALERILMLGFKKIIVLPYFLFTGVLVKRIHMEVNKVQDLYPDTIFLKAKYLSDHPLVIESFIERLNEISLGSNLMNCQLCKYREQIIGYEHDKGVPQVGHHHHVEGIGTEHKHQSNHSHENDYYKNNDN